MMTYYVIGGDGQRYGPEAASVIAHWAREGRVIHSTVLIETTSNRRLAAGELPEVAAELGPLPAGRVAVASVIPPGLASGRGTPVPGPKSKIAAGLLGIFLGGLGLHRFYLGYIGIGLIQLILGLGVFCIPVPIAYVWGAIEGILCLTGHMRDAQGRTLRD